MAPPVITALTPVIGPANGDDYAQISGTGFGPQVAVTFEGAPARIIWLRTEAGVDYIDILTPKHAVGVSAVTVQNLDSSGVPVGGETDTLVSAYTFSRFNLTGRSNLVRLVRRLLQDLKNGVLENTGLTTSVDFDYGDQLFQGAVVDVATLPSLTISGPDFEENRFLTDNSPRQVAITGPSGPEIKVIRPAFTVDLIFEIIGATNLVGQLLNLITGVATHFHDYKFVTIDKDPDDSSKGTVSYELDAIDEGRTRLRGGKDDIRVYTWRFRVRGFPLSQDDLAIDITKEVSETVLEIARF